MLRLPWPLEDVQFGNSYMDFLENLLSANAAFAVPSLHMLVLNLTYRACARARARTYAPTVALRHALGRRALPPPGRRLQGPRPSGRRASRRASPRPSSRPSTAACTKCSTR